jgi:hypothetical protein
MIISVEKEVALFMSFVIQIFISASGAGNFATGVRRSAFILV